MSIFTKPLSQIVAEDLEELLSDSAIENVRLEFKSEVPDKSETLKKLSSFANTFGGYLVVGAKASSADGRIESLAGVDEQSGYKQKVVDWCFGGASPPLTVEVSDPIPSPTGKGKVCYVIHTAESDVAPHFLNGRKGVWVRTDEFSANFEARLADENELRHLLDRRTLIRERRLSLLERARKRYGTYTGSSTAQNGKTAAVGPRLELCVIPRFPARPLCEQSILAPLVTGNPCRWRGITFPVSGSTTVSQHESAIVLAAAGSDSIFEANVWGMMFYCATIADAYPSMNVFGIHLYGFVGILMLFIRHAETMLRKLGYAGPIHIQMSLSAVRGVKWLYGTHVVRANTGSELDDDVEFSISTTSDFLHEKTDNIVTELMRYAFFSVNWPGLIDTRAKLEDLLRAGYQYNNWPVPESWGQ